MTNLEINSKVKELRELRRMAEDLQAEIDALQDEIKAEMTMQGVEILTGIDWKITWKSITQTKLDTTALKKALPDLVTKFSKTSTYKRFTIA